MPRQDRFSCTIFSNRDFVSSDQTDDSWKKEATFFDASLLLWTVLLFELTRLEVQSSLVVLFGVAPVVFLRCFVFRRWFSIVNGEQVFAFFSK